MRAKIVLRLCAGIVVCAILVGCAPREEPTVTYERSETFYTSGAAWGPPNDWNPFITWSKANTTGTIGLLYETLFMYDPLTAEWIPWLAESGDWVDADTYELQLREGIKWSDGEAMTAEDVVFTFELGQQYAALWYSPMWNYLDSVTADGDYGVVFEFTDPLYQEWSNNLYNIPMIFLEDTTGFLPGRDQETGGIVLEGRRLLDSIIDLRTPRITLIIRNAFGGAYASYNSYFVGASVVLTLPTARIAVMGPAGREFVYKDEIAAITRAYRDAVAGGGSEAEAAAERDAKLAALSKRYEDELLNPKEALALGSVSGVVMPGTTRRELARNLDFLVRKYQPSPMGGPQREFE